jgi:hypothetical protein
MAGRPKKNNVDISGMVEGVDYKIYTQIGANGKEYTNIYIMKKGKRGPKNTLTDNKKNLIKKIKKMDDEQIKSLLNTIG